MRIKMYTEPRRQSAVLQESRYQNQPTFFGVFPSCADNAKGWHGSFAPNSKSRETDLSIHTKHKWIRDREALLPWCRNRLIVRNGFLLWNSVFWRDALTFLQGKLKSKNIRPFESILRHRWPGMKAIRWSTAKEIGLKNRFLFHWPQRTYRYVEAARTQTCQSGMESGTQSDWHSKRRERDKKWRTTWPRNYNLFWWVKLKKKRKKVFNVQVRFFFSLFLLKENQAEVQKSIQDANEELHTLKESQKICTELFTEKNEKKWWYTSPIV